MYLNSSVDMIEFSSGKSFGYGKRKLAEICDAAKREKFFATVKLTKFWDFAAGMDFPTDMDDVSGVWFLLIQ